MTTKDTIKLLRNIAILLEIKGENQFKTKAYSNAADYLEDSLIDVNQIVADGTIKNINGFGKALQDKITEFVLSGELAYYNKLKEEIPESLIDITSISGLGPKKTAILYKELGITNLDELENACIENKILQVKGFAAKTQEMIFNSLSHKKASNNKFIQDKNSDLSSELIMLLKNKDNIIDAEISGDVRRFTEIFSEIEIVVNNVGDYSDDEINNKIDEISSTGIKVKIHSTDSDSFIIKLHETSCAPPYLNEFNNLLINNNIKLIDDKIYKNDQLITLNSEEEFYKLLNIDYVPPVLRETTLSIEKAINYEIPNLVKNDDLKGMFHFHTNWSDGKNTLREMALKAKELGFSYCAVCDHSAYAAYANGLTIDRVKSQFREIDKLNNEDIGITLLKGIESDILPDGSLDYSQELLAEFDIVVASVHSLFRMNKKDMTKRLIQAVKNPYSTIIGHPTGRLLLTRAGYEIDVDEFIQVCADYGKVIEINSNPYRLDFSWENAFKAKNAGVKLAINPDSHKTDTLKDVFIGVKSAQKAWLTKEDVINCLPLNDFINKYVKK